MGGLVSDKKWNDVNKFFTTKDNFVNHLLNCQLCQVVQKAKGKLSKVTKNIHLFWTFFKQKQGVAQLLPIILFSSLEF